MDGGLTVTGLVIREEESAFKTMEGRGTDDNDRGKGGEKRIKERQKKRKKDKKEIDNCDGRITR